MFARIFFKANPEKEVKFMVANDAIIHDFEDYLRANGGSSHPVRVYRMDEENQVAIDFREVAAIRFTKI